VTLGQELDLFYLPAAAGQPEAQEEEIELSDRDVVVGYYEGDRLDLGEVVREQVLLGLPLSRFAARTARGSAPLRKEPHAGPAAARRRRRRRSRLEPLRKLFDKKRQ